MPPHARTLIGSGGSECPAATEPSAGQRSAQKQPRPVIFPVSLKVSTVGQHGKKSGFQPLTMARRQVYHSDLWMRQVEKERPKVVVEKFWAGFVVALHGDTLQKVFQFMSEVTDVFFF